MMSDKGGYGSAFIGYGSFLNDSASSEYARAAGTACTGHGSFLNDSASSEYAQVAGTDATLMHLTALHFQSHHLNLGAATMHVDHTFYATDGRWTPVNSAAFPCPSIQHRERVAAYTSIFLLLATGRLAR